MASLLATSSAALNSEAGMPYLNVLDLSGCLDIHRSFIRTSAVYVHMNAIMNLFAALFQTNASC